MATSFRRARLSVSLIVALAAISPAPFAAPRPQTHTVIIENVQYNPVHLTVHRGDQVVWVNKDLFPHTVTATDKTFDSGSIEVSHSWTFQARKPGEFTYSCTFHPTMKGAIEVQ